MNGLLCTTSGGRYCTEKAALVGPAFTRGSFDSSHMNDAVVPSDDKVWKRFYKLLGTFCS